MKNKHPTGFDILQIHQIPNHPLFQDGILQDTVSNTTFSQTLIFQGGLTPILCTNQDKNFQYRFLQEKVHQEYEFQDKNIKTRCRFARYKFSRQFFSKTCPGKK